ncbi:MAG TPA: hypothetical protein VGG33_07170 [Polyangia bacterium]
MQTRILIVLSGILAAVPLAGCTPKASGGDAGANGAGSGGMTARSEGGRAGAAGGSSGAAGAAAPSGSGGASGGGGSTSSGGVTGSGGTSLGAGGSSGSAGSGAGGASTGAGGTMAGGDAGGGASGGGGSNGDANPDTRGRTVPDAYVFDGPPPNHPPITACAQPSVDHLRQFTAWSGTTSPPTGSNILTKDGNDTVAKISLIGCATWCQLVVPIANSLSAQVDLSNSAGFTMRYSAAASLFVQVRPASRYDGGDKWIIEIPATGGKVEERFFPFIPDAWFFLNRLGVPNYPFSTALKDVRAFNFVTNVTNELTIRGLRIDGHIPSCQ